MISNDKQFEYLGSQVKKHVQRSIEAFKLFLQIFSAIVGGSIWLSLQSSLTSPFRHRYVILTDAAAILLAAVVIVMVLDNLRAWRGYRIAMSNLAGKRPDGDYAIPLPLMRSAITERAILFGIAVVTMLFCFENPFAAL
jgi:hypothetical protein